MSDVMSMAARARQKGMKSMRAWFSRVFAGRRGPDMVCGALFLVGLVLSGVAWFTKNQLLGWLVYLPWALAVARMFSTRLEQRYQENRRFQEGWQRLCGRVRDFFQRPHPAAREVKGPQVEENIQYHHFVCPACAQKLRVPRGRGKLMVTCPKCGRVFVERS